LTELRRGDCTCLLDELARECNAPADGFVGFSGQGFLFRFHGHTS
jgi:hypothetical protein